MKSWLQKLWSDRKGQDMVEYALVAGLVAVACVAVMPALSASVSTAFSKLGSIITSAVN